MHVKKFIKDSLADIQKNLCDKVGQRVNRYSVRQRKLGLIVFGLAAGTICFLLIIGTLGSDDSGQAITTDSITLPKDIRKLSIDSLKSIPERVVDSLKSIIQKLYTDRLD